MPKSVSFTLPSGATRMLEGFTSRWTIPAVCAAARASATWARIGATWSGRQRAAGPHDLAEVGALDVLHDHPLLAGLALVHEVEDGDDVRVVEPGRQAGLPLGAPDVGAAAAGRGPDPLERDRAAEGQVGAAPHGAHAATTDLPVERVPACDHLSPLPSPPTPTVEPRRTAPVTEWDEGHAMRQAGPVSDAVPTQTPPAR